MNNNIFLEIKNVGYTIQDNIILKDINVKVLEKEIVSILGYNGSGKSTLLKLILGSLSPNHGEIKFKPGVEIGYVPQKLAFDRKLPITVQDFLDMYLDKKYKQSSNGSSSIINIKKLLDKPLSGLSGGQLQKVLVYCALAGEPNLLLLDEPTSGLDVNAQKDFYIMLESIHKQLGCTIIMVSHDIHTVYNKSDKVICLHNGICCTGKPNEDQLNQDIKEIFGSHVSPYIHHHDK